MGSFSIWHWLLFLAVILLWFGRGKVSELMDDFAEGINLFRGGDPLLNPFRGVDPLVAAAVALFVVVTVVVLVKATASP